MAEKQSMPVQELEKELLEFLNTRSSKPGAKRTKPGCTLAHGRACALGTSVDDVPRVTPVDFFNEGLTLWIAGEPGGKIANIMRNPKVSVGIYEPVDHTREQKSLQLFGTAELINLKNNPDEFKKRFAQFGLKDALAGVLEDHVERKAVSADQTGAMLEKLPKMFNWIKITPGKMILLHMNPGAFPLKKTWEPGSATVQLLG